MSENIPQKLPRKRKPDKTKLPTPPPDPTREEDVSKEDREILEYIESLHRSIDAGQYSRSASIAPVVVTEEAFDHLDKLYKLMEQMLELREQNAKLHRRIRDLEHLHNLEKMQQQLDLDADCPELEHDTAFAETILESILEDFSKKDYHQHTYQKQKSVVGATAGPARLRTSILRRNRTGSGPEKQVTVEMDSVGPKEEIGEGKEKNAKISKWTKVKAAFRWEKSTSSVADSKSQDSGIHVPVNVEIARYLRVPSTSDDAGHSPGDSGAGISTPGSLSTASSNEDFHRGGLRTPCEDFRSSEEETSPQNYIPHHKDEHTKSPHKFHRTTWAKMKNMIPTRSSFKKKNRLSAASDDIQIDVELCSDNEDVFEDELKSTAPQISSSPSPNPPSMAYKEIPPEVIERYQNALADGSNSSRWSRVKKAFLSGELKTQRQKTDAVSAEDEIKRNYKELQNKLSLEFQEKLNEWERIKQHSPATSNPPSSCGFNEEKRDPCFMKKMEEWQRMKSNSPTNKRSTEMTRETDLPPEFKKKLEEWEKMKKSSRKETSDAKKKLSEAPKWKSLSGHRSETSPAFEYPTLSEDFRKKLEEWKQIKASSGTEQRKPKEKTPSPKLSRKNSSPKHGKRHDKELHWFEKELGKIEKEKQRLERERQKFLEREERLSKLRRSVVGGNKKEVLIHTPSGFYRFEGISRKFTQKLYEWEKAQGIGPEASTFALLTSSCPQEYRPITKRHSSPNTPPLLRSKSDDSVARSVLNLCGPTMTPQPSSLSLNDVEELEKECMAVSKSTSSQFVTEQPEPEAVLVEVEDYEEETAAPLRTFVEKQHKAVYQREESKNLCESQTVVRPKIRRSESARAQTNYNLIDEIVRILNKLTDGEENTKTSKKTLTKLLTERLQKLQEANATVAINLTKEEAHCSKSHLLDSLDVVQDCSIELVQLAEELEQNISKRCDDEEEASSSVVVSDNIDEIKSKMVELRRNLSYVCAASDLTAPKRKPHTGSTETSDNSRQGSRRTKKYIKSETANVSSQGAVKKRIKHRQKSLQRTVPDTDEDEYDTELKKTTRQHKKLSRTRSISDGNISKTEDGNLEEKLLVTTETKYTTPEVLMSDSAVSLLVKTTRKLFTPIGENPMETKDENVKSLPPLPSSPMAQRKSTKEISPGIRMMLAKYNEKLSEQDKVSKSGGSSGSNSPVAWRSPIFERRVKAQTEKYQEEIEKYSPRLGNDSRPKEVQKSSSAGYLNSPPKQITIPARKTSLNTEKNQTQEAKRRDLTLDLSLANSPTTSNRSRSEKLRRAKEEFLKASPVSAPAQISEEVLKYPARSRLSQISMESESSYDGSLPGALMKSASAGMINIDPETYRQFDPEYHGDGYVSLPRNTRRPKEGFLGGKSAFSAIASKFRKVKMRRGKDKDKDKPNAVSTLCRQSLVVDINSPEEGPSAFDNNNSETSGNSMPLCKSNSWIKRSLFRK